MFSSIALQNLNDEKEELVITHIPPTHVPSIFSLQVWSNRSAPLVLLSFKERLSMMWNLLITGRMETKSVVLSAGQLLQLSSWVYQHSDPEPTEQD